MSAQGQALQPTVIAASPSCLQSGFHVSKPSSWHGCFNAEPLTYWGNWGVITSKEKCFRAEGNGGNFWVALQFHPPYFWDAGVLLCSGWGNCHWAYLYALITALSSLQAFTAKQRNSPQKEGLCYPFVQIKSACDNFSTCPIDPWRGELDVIPGSLAAAYTTLAAEAGSSELNGNFSFWNRLIDERGLLCPKSGRNLY